MEIVKPYAKIIGSPQDRIEGINFLRKIEYCARISHRSETQQTEDSWERFIKAVVLEHGDFSVIEHSSITVEFELDRGVTHELVRHRLFSLTQESSRFVNYEKKMPPRFVEPDFKISEDYQYGRDLRKIWRDAIDYSEISYKRLIAAGEPPQIARSVLPNALASRIIVTGNLRNWRHFLLMRTTKETHPDFKRTTIPLLEEFKARIPLLYDDIEPNARQIDNMRKPR